MLEDHLLSCARSSSYHSLQDMATEALVCHVSLRLMKVLVRARHDEGNQYCARFTVAQDYILQQCHDNDVLSRQRVCLCDPTTQNSRAQERASRARTDAVKIAATARQTGPTRSAI